MQSKDYPKLRNCPFCGGEAEKSHLKKRWHRVLGIYCPIYIRCKVCGIKSEAHYTVEYAIEAWNRRVDNDR